jgi:hypothetical protein
MERTSVAVSPRLLESVQYCTRDSSYMTVPYQLLSSESNLLDVRQPAGRPRSVHRT